MVQRIGKERAGKAKKKKLGKNRGGGSLSTIDGIKK